jgi:hypothetical protein
LGNFLYLKNLFPAKPAKGHKEEEKEAVEVLKIKTSNIRKFEKQCIT